MKETILIIAAMEDVELNYLKTKLKNIKEMEYKSFKFFEGEAFEKKIILCVSNIGLINSAVACTVAIDKYKPSMIINVGVARWIYKRHT